ncbi:MAG: FkbM family methyltransferase [Puniceicoccales bacterium]|jgi:FkbM family methyltransferase|nr:FkbM family methyltransferase [Puniceicoccales bacterium]
MPNHLNGNFKHYLLENDMPARLKALKAGLDRKSQAAIDRNLNYILNYPDAGSLFAKAYFCKNEEVFLTPAEVKDLHSKHRKWCALQKRGISGDYPTALFEHGLKELPKAVLDYITGKAFVDAGAYDGSSALVFKKYKPSKIYSFEISPVNLQKLRQNTANDRDIIDVIPMALFSHKTFLSFRDTGDATNSVFRPGEEKIETISLDTFWETKASETLGLLKADTEGAEMEILAGARKQIMRDRPLLSLSIYHNPKQFFEMKPYLESWNLGYKFFIRRYNPKPILDETTLIAYPKELDE